MASDKVVVHDAMASIIGHGLATRFPKLKFMPVEFSRRSGSGPFLPGSRTPMRSRRCSSTRTPSRCSSATFTSTSSTSPTPRVCSTGPPADRLMFGSDFPHPEGMADPLAYSEVVAELPLEQQALIMGGALERVMRVGTYA